MSELYSNSVDCEKLAIKLLYGKLRRKINFYGSTLQEVISGKYLSEYNRSQNIYTSEYAVPFYLKFKKDGFLRVQIGSLYPYNTTDGEKLAILSDFYEVLKEEYGEPTLFYTTKNDKENTFSLHWSFIDKDKDIEKFKNDTFFDDASIDKLIIIGENTDKDIKDSTKNFLSNEIGLPYELLKLVNNNIEDYIKYKKGINPINECLNDTNKLKLSMCNN